MGGGLGIQYTHEDAPPTVDELADMILDGVTAEVERRGLPQVRLMLEPGRSIVGPAGMTLYRIIVIKDLPGLRTYVSVDGGLSDNPRPCMYDAEYEAAVANNDIVPAFIKTYLFGT